VGGKAVVHRMRIICYLTDFSVGETVSRTWKTGSNLAFKLGTESHRRGIYFVV
jgi:hypothetical protein